MSQTKAYVMNTNTLGEIKQHPSAADLYIRHGWRIVEIPHGSKAPQRHGWNQENGWLTETTSLPPKTNLGLLHAFSGTMALDIDWSEQATPMLREAGISLQTLMDAPNAVTIESGNPGHGKLLYAMPFPLPTKKIVVEGRTVMELRCGTSGGTSVQDVLPPSLHPDTGQTYRWGGKGKWDHLPGIPGELLAYWQKLLETPEKQHSEVSPAELKEVRSALSVIPSSCDRESWLTVAMALHHEGVKAGQETQMYQLFSVWSAGDPANPPANYKGQHDIDVVWRSLRIDHSNPVTIGSLFGIAADYGWRRETPSAEALFKTNDPIDLVWGMRPVPPVINLDDVPPVLAERSREIGEIVGCDPLVPLFSGIGALCGAVDKQSRLRLTDGYEVPPILWLCTIGDPSDKKSPGSKPMMSILRELEREDIPRWKRAELEFKVERDMYEVRYKEFFNWYAEEHPENTVPPDEPLTPVEPHRLVLVVQDITSQKMMHHGAQQPRGLLCYLDEMNGWFKMLTKNKGTENTSTWISGYESSHARMDRIGAGTIECDPLSVSIYGNVQPWVWRENLPLLSADGFMARFIVAPLRGQMSKLSQPIPDMLTSKEQYEGMVRMAYAAPKQTYTLSPEAYGAFRENQEWILSRQRDEVIVQLDKVDKAFLFALGKADGTVGRLAFVFHMAMEPLNPVVSEKTMQMAIRFYRNYVLPALRFSYSEIGGMQIDTIDNWMAHHIIAISDKETITLRELKHSARRQMEHLNPSYRQQAILDSMMPLEQCQWVAPLQANPRSNEYLWAINPALKEKFADYRKQVLTIRQRLIDEIRDKTAARGQSVKERRLIPGYDPAWD